MSIVPKFIVLKQSVKIPARILVKIDNILKFIINTNDFKWPRLFQLVQGLDLPNVKAGPYSAQ